MYEIDDEDGYFVAWLEGESSAEIRQIVLDWLPLFAEQPVRFTKFRRYPSAGVPTYRAVVPDTDVVVDFTVDPPVEFDSPEALVGLRTIKVFNVKSRAVDDL